MVLSTYMQIISIIENAGQKIIIEPGRAHSVDFNKLLSTYNAHFYRLIIKPAKQQKIFKISI